MTLDEIKTAALAKAKAKFKGNTGLSRALADCPEPPTPQAISQWRQAPVERVSDLEAVTGIPRQLFRPDIFGAPSEDLIKELLAGDGAEAEA